jgi:adenosylhomocysteine nucleosidase
MTRFRLAVLVAIALASVASAAAVDLLLVASDEAEAKVVLDKMAGAVAETRGAWTLWRGALAGKTIVLTRAEGDPLNAVAATTLALRLHPARLVVVFGAARAHDPALQPGDLVVSERFAAFDGMVSPIVELGGGSDALLWQKRAHKLVATGEREIPTEHFPADARALAAARQLPPGRGRVVAGTLGSAHQVNREADRIAWLRQHWQTTTEDGESAHVAGCALLFGVPVVGLRVVDGSHGEAAEFALKLVEAWK